MKTGTGWRARRGAGARGFTLLEILVVVMIISILATLVGVQIARRPGEARQAQARAQIAILASALQTYRMEQGRYPGVDQGLEALCTRPALPPVPEKYPEEGYLQSRRVPADPWGRPYVYLVPGREGEPWEVLSYGADGEPGGKGEDADVSSSAL